MPWVCKKCGGDRIMETRYGVQRENVDIFVDGKKYPKINYISDGSIFECNGCGERAEKFEDVAKEV